MEQVGLGAVSDTSKFTQGVNTKKAKKAGKKIADVIIRRSKGFGSQFFRSQSLANTIDAIYYMAKSQLEAAHFWKLPLEEFNEKPVKEQEFMIGFSESCKYKTLKTLLKKGGFNKSIDVFRMELETIEAFCDMELERNKTEK